MELGSVENKEGGGGGGERRSFVWIGLDWFGRVYMSGGRVWNRVGVVR